MAYQPGVQDISGQLLGQGISQLGDSIAGGIQQYGKQKEERQYLTAAIESKLGNALNEMQRFQSNPKAYGGVAPITPEMLEQFQGAGGASLGKLKALNADLDVTLARSQNALKQGLEMAQIQHIEAQSQHLRAEDEKMRAAINQQAQDLGVIQQIHSATDPDSRNALFAKLSPETAQRVAGTMAELQKMATEKNTDTGTQKNIAEATKAAIAAGTLAPDPKAIAKFQQDLYTSSIKGNQRPVLTPEEEGKKLELTTRIKDSAEFNSGVIKAGQDARAQERNIDQALSLMESGAKSGFGSEFLLSAKRIGKELGFDVGDIKNAEQLQTLFGNEVMARVAQTKGAVSDREMKMFADYSASMVKTPEGNKQILQFAKQAYARARDIAAKVREMRRDGKSSEMDIQSFIEDYQDKNPIALAGGKSGGDLFQKADAIIGR